MKQFFVFVLFNILLISISTLQATEVQEPSPFFAWSSSNYIVGKNIYSYANYETSELNSIILATVDTQFTSEFINHETQPEVVVIYYGNSNLKTNIKNVFEHSQSSLALPYAYSVNSASSIQSLAQYAERVMIIGQSELSIENSVNVDLKEALKEIASGALLNGKVDVIVIDVTSETADSAQGIISKIENLLKKDHSSISFFFSDSKSVEFTFQASKNTFLPMKETGEQPPYSSRWPAYIIEGIATSAMLIFFLIIAVIYTSCVQSPDQFESKKVQHFVVQ